MAVELLFTDGCDHYATAQILAKWTSTTGGAIVATAPAGRGTTNAIWLEAGKAFFKTFSNQATVALGFAFYFTDLPATDITIVGLYDGTTSQCGVRVTSIGELRMVRGATSLEVTADLNLAINQWHSLGFVATIGDVGAWQVTLDGIVVLEGTGDTQASATAQTNKFYIQSPVNDGYFKDIYLLGGAGAAYLGDLRVGYFVPNGAGNYSQWTQSQSPAGANYQDVDEIPPDSDTTYNFSSTAGQKDSFAHAALSNAAAIKGLMIWSYARKDDAGVRTLREFLRISGADYAGSSRNILNTYLYYGSPFINNPASSPVAPFTPAEVDALEPGYELVA